MSTAVPYVPTARQLTALGQVVEFSRRIAPELERRRLILEAAGIDLSSLELTDNWDKITARYQLRQ